MANQDMVPKAFADMLLQQIAMLNDTVKSLQSTIEGLQAVIADKNQIILNQNRARFGQSSEKSVYVIGGEQTCMFDVTGDGVAPAGQATEEKPAEKTVEVITHKRMHKRTIEELCAGLPVEEIVVDLPDEQKVNADGKQLKCIGQSVIRKEIIRRPETVHLRVYIGKSYADPDAEERTGRADIRQASAPAPLLPKSYASASLVTDVLVKKFQDGLPLYRQEQMWKRLGVPLMRNTMGNWVVQTADTYFQPIWDRMKEQLLDGHVIHADETVLQVLK